MPRPGGYLENYSPRTHGDRRAHSDSQQHVPKPEGYFEKSHPLVSLFRVPPGLEHRRAGRSDCLVATPARLLLALLIEILLQERVLSETRAGAAAATA